MFYNHKCNILNSFTICFILSLFVGYDKGQNCPKQNKRMNKDSYKNISFITSNLYYYQMYMLQTMAQTGKISVKLMNRREPAMPKKSTKLEQLSEKIHITVEKMRNLGAENLDHMFLEIYAQQTSQLTDTRQHKKVKHLLKDVVGIVFFAVLAGNNEWTDIADFAADEKQTLQKYLELPNKLKAGRFFRAKSQPLRLKVTLMPVNPMFSIVSSSYSPNGFTDSG